MQTKENTLQEEARKLSVEWSKLKVDIADVLMLEDTLEDLARLVEQWQSVQESFTSRMKKK